jgi:hypothetical protein
VTALLGLSFALLLGQWLCGRAAFRAAAAWIRPAEEWDGEDVERWLSLIEPFPLRRPTPGHKA